MMPLKNDFSKQKLICVCIYAAAVFAAVYGAKCLIDGLVYAAANMGYMFKSAADILIKIFHVFAILVFGLVTAYILDPLVGFISQKFHLKRHISVFVIYIFIILIAAVFVYGILNRIYIYDKTNIANAFSLAFKHYHNRFSEIFAKLELLIQKYDKFDISTGIYKKLSSSDIDHIKILRRISSVLADFFIGLILAFYFLKDKDILLRQAKYIFSLIVPKKIQPVLLYIYRETDSVFSGYIRGQLADAVIISILAASLLTILRIPFAIAIGIITGFTNLIPYLGALIGLLLSTGAALLDGSPGHAAAAALLMLVLQQADSIIIAPRLVGERVSLSPAAVIAALGVFGNLFGLWGMVFAVPTAALIKIFSLRFIKKLEKKQ